MRHAGSIELAVTATLALGMLIVLLPGQLDLSAGSGVGAQTGAHGELAPARVSSQALTWGGSNVTFPPTGPRYMNHER